MQTQETKRQAPQSLAQSQVIVRLPQGDVACEMLQAVQFADALGPEVSIFTVDGDLLARFEELDALKATLHTKGSYNAW